MRISFITPKPGFNGYSFVRIPSLGPLYLGTILKNEGHEVRVYDEKLKIDVLKNIDDFILGSDFVGISIITANANRGYKIAEKIKELNSNSEIIFGGPHATALPEEALQYGDYVVKGEAELVISDIVNGKVKDKIIEGEKPDLDKLPYIDISILQNKKKMNIFPISTSRGCPGNCEFCYTTFMYGPKYRFRNGENISNEVKLRYQQGYRKFFFSDDNTTANKKEFKKALENIINDGLKITWYGESSVDVAKDEELLRLIKKSNCGNLQIGFESINQKTLERYNKKQKVEDIENCISKLNNYKIPVHGMFIIDGDSDNKNTILDTVKFAVRNKLYPIQFSMLFPIPGTRLYEKLEDTKRIFTKYWDWFDGSHIVFKVDSPKQLQKNFEYAYKKFYSIKNTMKDFFRFDFKSFKIKFLGYFYSRHKLREWKRVNKEFINRLNRLNL